MSTPQPTGSRPSTAAPSAPAGRQDAPAAYDAWPWVRAGLLGLPLYGALTLWAAREPQPNPDDAYEAWSRFVTAPEYVVTHVFGSGLGLVCVVFGTFALGALLLRGRTARLGMWATAVAAFAQCAFLFFTGVSAFGPPLEGGAFLAGMDLRDLPTSTADTVQPFVMLLAIVLGFLGNVLLGVAMARSRVLPVWQGVVWVLAALLMYPFGIVLGALTTGATPPTVLAGAALVALSGAGVVWRARREPAAAGVPAQRAARA